MYIAEYERLKCFLFYQKLLTNSITIFLKQSKILLDNKSNCFCQVCIRYSWRTVKDGTSVSHHAHWREDSCVPTNHIQQYVQAHPSLQPLTELTPYQDSLSQGCKV